MTSMKTSLSDSTDQTCDLKSGTLRSRSINWVLKDSSAVSQQPSCHKYCALHWRVFLLWWCHDCLPFVLNRKSLKPTPTPKVLSSQMPVNDGESNMYLLLHTLNHKRLKSSRMLKKNKKQMRVTVICSRHPKSCHLRVQAVFVSGSDKRC